MYTGRTITASLQKDGAVIIHYLVNSRSFKNRILHPSEGTVAVVPDQNSLDDFRNPYVTYNCLRHNENICVISNGSQTDPIFEKIIRGTMPRDALAQVMYGMDYEFDSQDTPRIAACASLNEKKIFVGLIKNNELHIKEIQLNTNKLFLISTNEFSSIRYDEKSFDNYEYDTFEDTFEKTPFFDLEHNILKLEVILGNKISCQI